MSLPFALVDVFAVEALTGNPLAVVDCGDDLPLDLYRRIAREFNQVETTFVQAATLPDADRRLRSFTAVGVEVFGAGHNALGAWWWLAASGRLVAAKSTDGYRQQLGDEVLPVTIEGSPQVERIVMQQSAPIFGSTLHEPDRLAAALGLHTTDLAVDLPCQVVSTGAAHLLVPIRDRDAVDRIRPDASALFPILQSVEAEGCYPFSLDPRQPHATAYARFFNPTVGIGEDPATGTAAGPLAAQLTAIGKVRVGSVLVEQGTAMGRTSLLEIEVRERTITLAGRCVIAATGMLDV